MQPYHQAMLQALSIPRYMSRSEAVVEITYPEVSTQLLTDLSLAFNQEFSAEQVVFGEQLIVTPALITLPYPLTVKDKHAIYQTLNAHFAQA